MTEAENYSMQPEGLTYHESRKPWEEVILDGERFLVKRGLSTNVEYEGKDVVFDYDEYHHPETGMEVKVWKAGMDQPKDNPAIVRLDYGCPCMELGTNLHLPGHDCAQQRELMFETIADLGIGVIATVSEQTAAGNGHGAFAVIEESNERYLAEKNGQPFPTMEESYLKRGYFPFDVRRHDLVARVTADSIGDRPVIPAMSSQTKVQHLREVGMHVVENVRVELISHKSEEVRQMLRRDGYQHGITAQKERGAYLLTPNQPPIRLTPDVYQTRLASPQHLVN